MAKVIEMPKRILMAKVIEMPKPKINQREFDDMFKGFIQQVDKLVAAKDMNAVVGFPEKDKQ